MPSATQVTPAASISTIVGEVFSGAWSRTGGDRTDNHPELFEIELFRHLASHTAEVALWTISGACGQESLDDEYSVPLPNLISLAGDYCWRVRLRDQFGTWTAWSSKTVFELTSEAPVLSNPTIPDGASFETLAHVFFGADYSDADGDRPHRLYIVLHPSAGTPIASVAMLMRPTWVGGYLGGGVTHIRWQSTGDAPQGGDVGEAKVGLFSYVGSSPKTGLQSDGYGAISIELIFSAGRVTGGNLTFTARITVNGVTVGSSQQSSSGGLRFQTWDASLSVSGINVEPGDDIEGWVDNSQGIDTLVPTGVGSGSHHLRAAGDLSDEPAANPDIVLWDTHGQYYGLRDSTKVGTRYNGRSLPVGEYFWEMYATDRRGSQSNTLSGQFTLTKGYEPDPGASPNLTGLNA